MPTDATSPESAGVTRSRVPRATYRLQFHQGFRLNDAVNLIPYLNELGVSHVYASPLLKAQPGSMHGYDVCDPTQLNPEIGSEDELARFSVALREAGMGLVIDTVPNHMGIGGPENRWWWNVLTHGPRSPFARYFDIDWDTPDPRTRGKVLMPVLGDRYGAVLERRELKAGREGNTPVLRYFDHQFPLDPASISDELNSDPPIDILHQLIWKQHYRLAYWRHGDAELNYRRFFNITTLAALRIEQKDVFEHTHCRIFEWWQRGILDGLRIDHPDGLRDPEEYLERLRDRMPDAWIVVEKILGPKEPLRSSWPVEGTSGYDFINRAGGLFVDRSHEERMTAFYVEFTAGSEQMNARGNKRLVLAEMFVAEVDRLVRLLFELSARDWRYTDLSPEELRAGISELVACFPVYRTYIRAQSKNTDTADAAEINAALKLARAAGADIEPAVLDLLEQVLLLQLDGSAAREFAMRFQQLTAATMAKGIEDTAFYRFNRFVALNEVGGDPEQFGTDVEAFHAVSAEMQRNWPATMLGSSTHDTKRSEDVRARLYVLSEIPEQWSAAVRHWSNSNEHRRRGGFPDRNTEYLFYQTLVGAWPISIERIVAYMEKAVREGKQHTTWTNPNSDYERAVREFVEGALSDEAFVRDVDAFVAAIVEPGQINSLSQTLLKLTAPGVPDIYQGTELWDFSLVDPDNRRPVDFEARRCLLDELGTLSVDAIWARRNEGLPKLWLIRQALGMRRSHGDWFMGAYEPLHAGGTKAAHVIAFLRGKSVIAVAPRLTVRLAGDWADTVLDLPGGDWRNVLTDELWQGRAVGVRELFARFPVALLVPAAAKAEPLIERR